MQKKTVLVTGASRGIGHGIAKAFISKGDVVIGTATSESGLKQIQSLSDDVLALPLDQSNPSSTVSFLNTLRSKASIIDVLINNAGATVDNLALRMKQSEWDRVLAINLSGVFQLIQGVLKVMLKRRYGRIVTLSSVVACTGNVGQANYAASKAALIAMSKSIAQEVAARNITLNVIAPGLYSNRYDR